MNKKIYFKNLKRKTFKIKKKIYLNIKKKFFETKKIF